MPCQSLKQSQTVMISKQIRTIELRACNVLGQQFCLHHLNLDALNARDAQINVLQTELLTHPSESSQLDCAHLLTFHHTDMRERWDDLSLHCRCLQQACTNNTCDNTILLSKLLLISLNRQSQTMVLCETITDHSIVLGHMIFWL